MANEKRKQCRVTFTMRADLAAILMKPLRRGATEQQRYEVLMALSQCINPGLDLWNLGAEFSALKDESEVRRLLLFLMARLFPSCRHMLKRRGGRHGINQDPLSPFYGHPFSTEDAQWLVKAVDQKIKERKELSGEQLSPLAACKLIKGQGRCRGCPSDYCAKKAAGTMANHYRRAKKVIMGGQTPQRK